MTTAMLREIAAQPAAVAATLDGLLPRTAEIRRAVGDRRQVVFIARGTSDNAAVYGQYAMSTVGRRLATLASPSVATVYRAQLDLRDVVAVAVSQSGATEEIVETLRWAAAGGARTIAVTNDPTSPLAVEAELSLPTVAGVEEAVPATKTYTTQLAALAVLALALGEAPALVAQLARVPEQVDGMLGSAATAEALAARLTYADRVIVSARGYATSAAHELALKLAEACYVSATGMSYADLLHGPIAVLDRSTPVVLLAAAADTGVLPGMTALAARCTAAGADVFGIGGDQAFRDAVRWTLPGPDLPAPLAPIPLIVPGQLLTEALARAKGLDPDTPRGLRKITQTT